MFAGQLHRQQPGRSRHQPQRFYNNPGTVATNVTPGGNDRDDGAALRPAGEGRRTARASPVVGATLTANETTGYPSPYTAVCMNGGATGTAPTLGLVTTRRRRD